MPSETMPWAIWLARELYCVVRHETAMSVVLDDRLAPEEVRWPGPSAGRLAFAAIAEPDFGPALDQDYPRDSPPEGP